MQLLGPEQLAYTGAITDSIETSLKVGLSFSLLADNTQFQEKP